MIFICGHHNTGKTTLANWLKDFGFTHIETGEIVRGVYKSTNQEKISFPDWATKVSLDEPHFFDNCVLDELKKTSSSIGDIDSIIITGNRQLSGIRYLIENFPSKKNVIIFLEAPIEDLFNRQLSRKDRMIQNLTLDFFKNDYIAFDENMGVQEIKEYSDYVVDASKSIIEVREKIKHIINSNYKLIIENEK